MVCGKCRKSFRKDAHIRIVEHLHDAGWCNACQAKDVVARISESSRALYILIDQHESPLGNTSVLIDAPQVDVTSLNLALNNLVPKLLELHGRVRFRNGYNIARQEEAIRSPKKRD